MATRMLSARIPIVTAGRDSNVTASAASCPFPDSPRVIYRKDPLVQVVCQLRFPPVLRIEAEPPAAFQDRIRKDYPLLRERMEEPTLEGQAGLPPAIERLIQATARAKKVLAYDFLSADEQWAVALTREFIAVTTTRYQRWE